MKILKMIGFVLVAIVALTVFGKIRQRTAATSAATASTEKKAALAKDPGLSPQGFFLMKREGEKNRMVTVFTAPNCPSQEAQRARELMASVQAAGIPCEEKQGIELNFTDPDDTARMVKYGSTIENPLVIVSGWGKGNPTAEQVIAEYRSRN